jgi:hypothetical protein
MNPAESGKAGVGKGKIAAGRLRLLDTNATVYREIVPRLVAVAPEAMILVVTDPPDPLADLARQLAGHDRVLSTGTYLDSLRFQFHLTKHLKVSAASVEALFFPATLNSYIEAGSRQAFFVRQLLRPTYEPLGSSTNIKRKSSTAHMRSSRGVRRLTGRRLRGQ